jgi:putative tricarboxylic transport membrane protein
VGSGFWPLLILFAASFLSLALFLRSLWTRGRAAKETPEPRLLSAGESRALLAIAIVLTYLVLVPWLGFIATTPVFIFVFMWSLGERRAVPLVTAPILTPLGVYLFFIRFVSIPLPRGSGIFLNFSRMFY